MLDLGYSFNCVYDDFLPGYGEHYTQEKGLKITNQAERTAGQDVEYYSRLHRLVVAETFDEPVWLKGSGGGILDR